jgi:septal ring factor EnvC (AmiA/AmiB activator)
MPVHHTTPAIPRIPRRGSIAISAPKFWAIAAILAGVMATLACGAALAQDADVERRVDAEKEKLRTAMRAEQGALKQLYAIDAVRFQHERQLRNATDELRRIEKEIADDQAQTENLEADLPIRSARLVSRLANLYRMGRGGFWKVLLSSDSYRSFVRRYRALQRVVQADAEALTTHRAQLIALRAKRDWLRGRQAQLTALREQARQEAIEVEVEKRKKMFLLDEIRRNKTLANQLARDLATQDAAVGRTVANMAPAAPAGATARPPLLDFPQRRGILPVPVAGPIVGRFGTRLHEDFGTQTRSNGIDIGAPAGAPVRAVADGVVSYIGEFLGYGRVLIVDHGQRYHTLYAHLGNFAHAKGDVVYQGDVLGTVGAAGLYAEPALHFEIRYKGAAIDPLQWLSPSP